MKTSDGGKLIYNKDILGEIVVDLTPEDEEKINLGWIATVKDNTLELVEPLRLAKKTELTNLKGKIQKSTSLKELKENLGVLLDSVTIAGLNDIIN